jgi:hypothetical protein
VSQQLAPPNTQQSQQVTELTEDDNKNLWLKVFLIDSSSNQNDWKASEEYIKKNVSKFIGKPFILTKDKKHPDFVREGVVFGQGEKTLNQILTAQNQYKIGEIKKVEEASPSQYHAYIQITDPKIIDSFKKGHIPRFVSPSVFDPNGTEDGNKMGEFEPLHIAAVDEPAYGVKAYVRGACDGEASKCLNELKSADVSCSGGPTKSQENKCPCSILETFTNKFHSSYLKNASLSQDSLSQQLQKPETIIAEITPQVETSKLEQASDTNINTPTEQPSLTNNNPVEANAPNQQQETVEKRGRKAALEGELESLKQQLTQLIEWQKGEQEKAVKRAAEEQRATIEAAITPETVGGDEEKRRQIIDNIVGLNFSNEQLQFVLSLLNSGNKKAVAPPQQVRQAAVNTLVLNQNSPKKESHTYFSSGFFGDL